MPLSTGPEPAEQKLTRIPGVHPEHRDARLRDLLANMERGDRVASAIGAGLQASDIEPLPDAVLAEIDSWWTLHDYIAQGHSVEEVRQGLHRLAEVNDAFGDTIGARAYTDLGETARSMSVDGVAAAYSVRATARLAALPVEVRHAVAEVDAHVLQYLLERRPDELSVAAAAWHPILMNEARLRADPSVQACLLNDAAIVMRDACAAIRDPLLLDRSIRCWKGTFDLFRHKDLSPSACLINLAPRLEMAVRGLASGHMSRYRSEQREEDFREALRYFESAVTITPCDGPTFVQRLADLGGALHEHTAEAQVVRGNDLVYFAAALERDDAKRVRLLTMFAAQAWARFVRFQTLSSLWYALTMADMVRGWPNEAVSALPEDARTGFDRAKGEDERVGRAVARMEKEELSVGELLGALAAGLEQDVLWMIHALFRLADTRHSHLAMEAVNTLAAEILKTYPHSNDLPLLDRSAEALEILLAHPAADSAQRRTATANLSVALTERYQRLGDASDLHRAIDMDTALVADSPDDPGTVGRLGGLLSLRHRITMSVEDLDEGIRMIERSIALSTAAGQPTNSHDELANALLDRWQVTSNLADLERALAEIDDALAVPQPPHRQRELRALKALCLHARYAALGEERDLVAAVELCRTLLAEAPPESKERPGLLHTLGICLRSMNAVGSDRAVLDEAVRYLREAVEQTAPTSPHWASYLSDLGTALIDRYEALGSLQDLDASIDTHNRALAGGVPASTDRPLILQHVAGALLQRFHHSRVAEDLDSAVAAAQEAVELSGGPTTQRIVSLNVLGSALFQRMLAAADARSRGSRPQTADHDLQDAIAAHEEAVAIARSNSERATSLNNLGIVLFAFYDRTRDVASLSRAIRVVEDAISVGSTLVHHLPRFWLNLAIARKAQAIASGTDADVARAVEAYRKACEVGANLSSEVVVHVARTWGDWALSRSAFVEAADAYLGGLRAFEDLFRVQATREHKETWLREAQGFSLFAAYALAKTGEVTTAVEAFERGRAMMLSEALQIDRVELERLGTESPDDIGARYQRAAAQWKRLSMHPPVAGEGLRGQTVEAALREARSHLDAVIQEIRALDGHSDFMRPPTFGDVAAASRAAPFVYLGATPAGGLALVVRGAAHPPMALWLPELTAARLDEQIGQYGLAYVKYRTVSPPPAEDHQAWCTAIDSLTSWVWSAAMEQVVRAVGDAPRATLVPAGLLGLIPLHAAWTHDPTNVRTGRRYALDGVSWTYAPNARAINAASAARSVRGERLLAVDQPTLDRPDLDLPFSAVEVAAATAAFPDHQILAHDAATPENTLRALADATYAHLSCHGSANFDDPLQSAIVLAGGAPLRLREILRGRLVARLIVLSACESGLIGSELPDEVVSLPAGYIQAGAAAAVASLWTVPGRATAMLMFRFYELWRSAQPMAAVDALRHAQIWVRDTTNAEKAAHFRRSMRGSPPRTSPEAAEALWRELFPADPDARSEAHPYHWAAFTYMGVHDEAR